jgi:hypothetical protein
MFGVLHGRSSRPSCEHRRASNNRPLAGHESSSIPRRQRPRPPRSGDYSRGLGRLVIFHPRRHKWSHHFRYHGGELIGRTAIGRTTVEVLQINRPNLVALRELLMEDGLF